jgi:hypothetical protein
MRRAAQANWSRLPNHNPPRFYTAWVKRVGFAMSAVCLIYPQHQTFPRLRGLPWGPSAIVCAATRDSA